MIKSAVFESESLLNDFVEQNGVKVLSVETLTVKYNTGLPSPHGGSFITDREVLKVWYDEENENEKTYESVTIEKPQFPADRQTRGVKSNNL